ncbi:hypothetical protein [Mariniblastus fucicola]|uniref:Uncharacterized protein n=1 Tax=Mariniblastus fucicola TaxID=980251 RepID=A0A5B9PIM7_9BACT|nr:hypothetical protein [Mariniblastus fucicola]QEG25100.1 hypothetical protein MFFC18_50230 [Mariniblastus fucicola]
MSEAHSPTNLFRDRFLDRLCLQFLSAGDWKSAIADSGLPEQVQTRISDVVEQTGLLRFEKSEIATELIHHFQDGHERGQTFDELVRDFGTTEVAVSLFRSSKLRSRPMSVKAFRGSVIVFGGSFLSYLLLQLFFHSAKPNPTVDYSAKLNEAVTSSPADQQAWPIYRDLWIKYGLSEGGGENFKELYVDLENSNVRLIKPSDKNWPEAVAKLESMKELLDTWRSASKLPHLGTPLHSDLTKYSDDDLQALYPNLDRENLREQGMDWEESLAVGPISDEANRLMNQSVINILLPHVQQFREAARVLQVDTRLAIEQGDRSRALENIKAIHGLARQSADAPIAVCSFVGFAVHAMGFAVVEEVLIEHPDFFSDEQLHELKKSVAEVDLTATAKYEFEEDMAMDMIQRIYSDDGNGDGRLTAVGAEIQYMCSKMTGLYPAEEEPWHENSYVRSMTAPVNLFSAPTRMETVTLVEESFDELEQRVHRPMWEDRDFTLEERLEEKDGSGMLSGLIGQLGRLKDAREIKIAYQDAVLLAIACHQYRRAEGEWPDKLEQLKGKWLEQTPIDRLNGKPLNFVIKDDAPVVYSLGHDGDDDGGVDTDSNTPWLDQNGDGDWVVWPQADY